MYDEDRGNGQFRENSYVRISEEEKVCRICGEIVPHTLFY
jgi:hypothetical protein